MTGDHRSSCHRLIRGGYTPPIATVPARRARALVPLPEPDCHSGERQRGDERAFACSSRATRRRSSTTSSRMVGDRSLAEDLTPGRLPPHLPGLAGFSLPLPVHDLAVPGGEEPGARRAARPRARGRTRTRSTTSRPLEVVDAPPERIEMIDAVWRAVGALNPDLKMALLLRDVVGLSYAEIADSLEITLATVKWRIYKAREEVQLALAPRGHRLAPAGTPRRSRRDGASARPRAVWPGSRAGPRRGSRCCVRSTSYSSRRKAATFRRGRAAARRRAGRRPAAGRPSRG